MVNKNLFVWFKPGNPGLEISLVTRIHGRLLPLAWNAKQGIGGGNDIKVKITTGFKRSPGIVSTKY
jgi:hypothetical protein